MFAYTPLPPYTGGLPPRVRGGVKTGGCVSPENITLFALLNLGSLVKLTRLPFTIHHINHMSTDSLDIIATRPHLYTLAQTNHLSPQALEYALRMIGCIPDRHAWRRFLDQALLWLGTTLCLAGIIFFFAYNWTSLSRFSKFGTLEIGLFALILLVILRGLESLPGKAALLAAAFVLGALLAVYGQVYQTGADVFTLFLTWAILILPWVFFSHFAPLWLLLLILANLSLSLYWDQVFDPTHNLTDSLFLLMFVLNGLALMAWEMAFKRGIRWLQGQWLGRIIFIVTLAVLILPTLKAIITFDSDYTYNHSALLGWAVALYLETTAVALWYYGSQRRDLFLLTVCLTGILITVTTLLGKSLPWYDVGSWFLMGLVVIAQASYMAYLLMRIAKTWGTNK